MGMHTLIGHSLHPSWSWPLVFSTILSLSKVWLIQCIKVG
jgi:hypothetical protein